jgi:type IV secretion system protein VirD4
MNEHDQQVALFIFVMFLLAALARRRWRPSVTAFGTACWASEKMLKAAGMLGASGLILGRTLSGEIIRARNYCHVLLVGATGAGKGVSIVIPNLLSYYRGSVVCFDTKGDLFATCGSRRRARGQRIIRLAPFNNGKDSFNPLDSVRSDSPLLIDFARAIAEALVIRQGTEHDPHWNDKAAQLICALLVLVLIRFKDDDRNLSSVQELASDPALLVSAANTLRQMGGIPARLGNQIKTLFENEQTAVLSKEGASVLSSVARHLSFLDSEPVGAATAKSTFRPVDLLKRGTTLFLQIPPDQLDAQKGLLRCWISTLVRAINAAGDERGSEVLFMIDEASALGSLAAVEEALIRGRSAGVRMLLAYQSDSQVRVAFRDKPTLLYDNCSTQIYLGAASSIETAERISKSLGSWTQVVEGFGENNSRSWNEGGYGVNQGQNVNRGSNLNYSVSGRALLMPEEVLTLGDEYLIAFVRGMKPILARRIKWYRDPAFRHATTGVVTAALWWLLVGIIAFVGWAALKRPM